MLSKPYRLPIQDFIGKKGKVIKTPYFVLKRFSAERPFSRFGIVISSKVFRRAVDRNRLKRQIFNFLRELKENLPIGDYLIIALPPIAQLKKDALKQELFKLLNYPIT